MQIQFHRHRIIPGHLGGTYEPRNVVRVNVAMHAVLHEQLWKLYGYVEDKLASDGLRGLIGQDEIVAELHRLAGPKISRALKGRQLSVAHREKIGLRLKGKPISEVHRQRITASLMGRLCSESTREKIRQAHIGRPTGRDSWNKGQSGYHVTRVNGKGWHHSDEYKTSMSVRMLGNQHAAGYKHTEEWKAENSARNLGSHHAGWWHQSEETKARISTALRGKVFSQETIEKRVATRKRNKEAGTLVHGIGVRE